MKFKLFALIFGFVFTIHGYAQTEISQWDMKINQWRSESLQLKASQIPALETAAQSGDVRAAYLLYLETDKTRYGYVKNKSSNQIASWAQKIADSGNPIGLQMLCYLYREGVNGVEKNPQTAFTMCQRAADKGLASAMSSLGYLYESGTGVTKNEAEAVKWYEKGAEGGDGTAMAKLGEMYRDGKGVTKNEAEAVKWFEKGAAAHSADAMKNLAWMYANGKGVIKNETEAAKWYKKAANPQSEILIDKKSQPENFDTNQYEEEVIGTPPVNTSYTEKFKINWPRSHNNAIYSNIIENKTKKKIYTGDHTGVINIWDENSKKLIGNHSTYLGSVGGLSLDEKRQVLIANSFQRINEDYHVTLMDVNEDLKEIDYFNVDFDHNFNKNSISTGFKQILSEDGRKLFLKNEDMKGDISEGCFIDLYKPYDEHQEVVKLMFGTTYRLCEPIKATVNPFKSKNFISSYCKDKNDKRKFCIASINTRREIQYGPEKVDDSESNETSDFGENISFNVLSGITGSKRFIYNAPMLPQYAMRTLPMMGGVKFITDKFEYKFDFKTVNLTKLKMHTVDEAYDLMSEKHPQVRIKNNIKCEKEINEIFHGSANQFWGRSYKQKFEAIIVGDAFAIFSTPSCTKKVIGNQSFGDKITDLVFTVRNGRVIAVVVASQWIRFYDVESGQPLIDFAAIVDDQLAVITTEGYFSLPASLVDSLVVVNKSKKNQVSYESVSSYFDIFNRPDIVIAKLRGEDIRPLIGDLTIEKALQNPPPKVSFDQVSEASAAKRLKIPYTITPDAGGIAEVRVFHNGKLISSDGTYKDAAGKAYAPVGAKSADAARYAAAQSDARNAERIDLVSVIGSGFVAADAQVGSLRNQLIVRGAPEKKCNPCKGEVEIDVVPGEENTVTVVAFNRDNTVQSVPASVTFKSTLPKEEPRLWVVAVGVDHFQGINSLTNARKDAQDFVCSYAGRSALAGSGIACNEEGKAKTLFKPENVRVVNALLDDKATKANVLAALDNVASQAKPQDTFVWFVASHGMMDANGLFGIIAHDTKCLSKDCSSLQGHITSNEILDASKKIKAMKQLMVLDTCHSGGLDSKMSGLYDARVSLLAKNMGLHMYASAQATETAQDGVPGTNGTFTAQLLAGIRGAAPKNAEGEISVMTLGQYAKQKTMEATATQDGAKSSRATQTPVIQHFGQDAGLVK